MKLIDLSLVLILASCSEGQDWGIKVEKKHVIRPGSDLTIPCSFTYPLDQHTENVTVYWKIPGKKKCSWYDKNKGTFIFHKDVSCVEEKYRNRTRLVGNPANGECSLKIFNIRENIRGMFARVYAKKDGYSFDKVDEKVSVFVTDATSVTENPELSSQSFTGVTTEIPTAKAPSTWMYPVIFVPVSALVIILLIAGIVFCKKRKRSQSFTRKESGYYANFSRASSDPPKREVSDSKDKELPDPKAIDEPVYINVEAPTYEMDQSMDITDNVYANVDYTK